MIFALASCQSSNVPSAHASITSMIRTELFFGLSRPSGPDIKEAEFVVFLDEIVTPRFPDGFGDPGQTPLFPQKYAELMAGRRMLASDRWKQVASLDEVVVGSATALEIRWRQNAE